MMVKRVFWIAFMITILSGNLFSEEESVIPLIQTKEDEFLEGVCDETVVTNMEDGEVRLIPPLACGTWTKTTSLPERLSGFAAVTHKGRLYIMGGRGEGDQSVSTVYMAEIGKEGGLSKFIKLMPLPSDLHEHTAFLWDGKIYVTGGSVFYKESGQEKEHLSSTIYSAEIEEDGTIKEWKIVGNLPYKVFRHQTVIVDGWLYLIGGDMYDEKNGYITTTNKIWHSLIQPGENSEGNIGAWKEITSSFSPSMVSHTALVTNRRIYVVGKGDNIYYMDVEDDGSLKMIKDSEIYLPYSVSEGGGVIRGGAMIYAGGLSDGVSTSTVLSGRIEPDGEIGSIVTITPLPEPQRGHSVTRWKDFLYIIGGKDGEDLKKTIWYTQLKSR